MDKETIQSFSDMVAATEKLTKPWKLAVIVTNVLWAMIAFSLIWFAYMTPVDVDQTQDFQQQTQVQSYSEGVTQGK